MQCDALRTLPRAAVGTVQWWGWGPAAVKKERGAKHANGAFSRRAGRTPEAAGRVAKSGEAFNRRTERALRHSMRSRASTARAWIVEPIGLEVRTLPKPVSGRGLFGNDHPVEMEIGAGKGAFLTEEAENRPAVNFIGLERSKRYWRLASDRARRHGCSNTRLVLVDAAYFLNEFVPDDFLDAIYVHFPDPWPKKRHQKRRLIQPEFLQSVERVLTPGGRFQVVTDHKGYFDQLEDVVSASSLLQSEYRPPATAGAGELVGSNFEKKYRLEGKVSHAIAAVRRSAQLRKSG